VRSVTDFDAPTYAAIDPGGVTGVAFYAPGDGFWSAEVPGGSVAFAPSWRNLLAQRTVAHVVVEQFIITPATATKTRQHDALDIIGWLKLECPFLGIPFSMQSPSKGKSFGTDAKLKHLGWYDRTPGGHRNDAARHLLTLLADMREPGVMKKLEEMA
jgi:hypothetical protein